MTADTAKTTGLLALSVMNEAMVAYARQPVVRALVTVIPFGSFFDALVGMAGCNLVLDRAEVLGEQVREAPSIMDGGLPNRFGERVGVVRSKPAQQLRGVTNKDLSPALIIPAPW